MHKAFQLISFFFFAIISDMAMAQEGNFDAKTFLANYNADNSLGQLDSGLMGDSHDIDTGVFSFQHTDVSLKGNSGLSVNIARRISASSYSGDVSSTNSYGAFGKFWELDIPYVLTRSGHDNSARCDMSAAQKQIPWTHNIGVKVNIPGIGEGTFGPNATQYSQYSMATKSYVMGNCTSSGGFVVTAPNGYKYTMDVKRIKTDRFLVPYTTAYGTPTRGYRELDNVYRYPSRIEDVNGNWVQFSYNTHGPTRIWSNDGREITLTYTNNLITRVSANGRSWNYSYSANNVLTTVEQPDGRKWENLGFGIFSPSKYACERLAKDGSSPLHNFTMKHPSGTQARFEYRIIWNHRKNYPTYAAYGVSIPFNQYTCTRGNLIPTTFASYALMSKTLILSDGTEQKWTYSYDESEDRGVQYHDLPDNKKRTIIDPENHKTVHYIDRRYNGAPGKTVKVEHYQSAVSVTPLSVQETDYIKYAAGAGHNGLGYEGIGLVPAPPGSAIEPMGTNHFLASKVTIAQDGDTYSTEYDYVSNPSSSSFSFAKPTQTKSYSNVSTTPRIIDTTYEHNTSKWILGLPKTVKRTDGVEMARYNYDSLGRKTHQYRYGQLYKRYTYHGAGASGGAPFQIFDGLNRRTELRAWKRGTPQQIHRPDNISVYQYVDNNGWVTSSKDAMNRTTTYTRDNMGRLTLINPHGNWANTSITYNFPTSGGAVQTITKGQSKETVTYDSMFRPVLERTQALDTGWSSYVNTEYDGLGRVMFKSQPSLNSSETKGVDYTYDGLGRIYQERENVAPYATTKHRYYRSHLHRIHDPSGALTDYYSYGYEGPGNTDYRAIYKYANGAYQQLNYLYKNVHGQLFALRQWKEGNWHSEFQTQWFYYGADQRLCRHYVPEHGTTKYQYNAAGEMTAYAKGQPNSGCGNVPNVSAKVSQTYDALGRPTLTNFTDPATPDISRTYDANSNLKTVRRDGVNWTYNYNDADMLTHEYLDIDGRNYDSFSYYNTSGHLTRKRMPSGRNVYYTPDGLGRSKTVKNGSATIASATSFHPNGSLAGMTYGNGQRFTQTLNARLLPQRIMSVKGGHKAIDQTLSYDARGKVTSIIDGAVSGNNRTFDYDGLGRLTSATGPWGTGSFKYDALNNLLQKKLGSRTVNLTYDKRNRLTQSVDTGASGYRAVGHDAQGNVTSLGNLSFIYDYSDQPVVVSGSANGVGAANGSYTYDGNLKRVKSVVNGKTIYNVYDASGSLVHIDAVTDNKKTDYVSGPNGSLARITNNVVTYLHPDHLGSAQSGTNQWGGIAWREQYSPFGEELQSPAANDNLAGFTGHIKDKATGLNYMQARYYDPVIGRFLSVDPVDFMTSGYDPTYFNRYAYVGNDPVNMIDPFGLCGNRYDDGSCQVKVDADTGQAGIDAGKLLESGLNELDKQINALDPKSSFDVTNSDGDSLGSFTGEELQDAWNNQEWSISGKDHGNGGLGGAVPGSSIVQPEAVTGYAAHASAVGQGSRTGVNTLITHEMGHVFGPGLALAEAHPVTDGQANPISERGASAQGRSIGRAIGKGFSCSTPGDFGC